MKKQTYAILFGVLLVLTFCSVAYSMCDNCSKERISNPQPSCQKGTGILADVAVSKPKMQVVFLLDATGSMSGLIGTAKEKIWSIASSMTQTTPAPDLEIGMIFYRDRGDEFVTKHIPLGKDLDDLYEQLMEMQAEGGGDEPESVNQALHEAITQMQWDSKPKTYKSIFLVGDCPPHMDYQDDVKYPASCAEANKKNITINTILMGNNSEAGRIWKSIAQKTNGEFIQTNMNVNNISIRTPYDKKINNLQYELDQTRIYYGKEAVKMTAKQAQSEKMAVLADEAINARRAEYNLSESGKSAYYGAGELINDVKNGKELSFISVDELPETMRNMSDSERKKYVDSLIVKREQLEQEIQNLGKQRQQHIDAELESMDASIVEKSFDDVVYEAIKEQAETMDIQLEDKVKR